MCRSILCWPCHPVQQAIVRVDDWHHCPHADWFRPPPLSFWLLSYQKAGYLQVIDNLQTIVQTCQIIFHEIRWDLLLLVGATLGNSAGVNAVIIEIETGRFRNIPSESRMCQFCKNEIEDELHFVCVCPVYSNHRKILFNEITLIWT